MTMTLLATQIILFKKEELAALHPDESEDPAMLHHMLSKLPTLHEEPADDEPGAARRHGDDAEDEDLMSSISHSSYDLLASSTAGDSSHLSSSTGTLIGDDEDYLTEIYTNEALSDPDIEGPAFGTRTRRESVARRPPPPPAPPPAPPSLSVEKLIQRTYQLYEDVPLLGPGGIDADKVMGANSCVFTWQLSLEGRLSDADADKLAQDAKDVVILEAIYPPPPPPASSDSEEEDVEELKRGGRRGSHGSAASAARRRRRANRTALRRKDVGLTVLALTVGAAAVLYTIKTRPDVFGRPLSFGGESAKSAGGGGTLSAWTSFLVGRGWWS